MGIDLKNWMQNLPDGSDLLALNLCGTHDCVTQHIRLPHFFCCQDLTVYEQLLLGCGRWISACGRTASA